MERKRVDAAFWLVDLAGEMDTRTDMSTCQMWHLKKKRPHPAPAEPNHRGLSFVRLGPRFSENKIFHSVLSRPTLLAWLSRKRENYPSSVRSTLWKQVLYCKD